jgi:hypothetical protein
MRPLCSKCNTHRCQTLRNAKLGFVFLASRRSSWPPICDHSLPPPESDLQSKFISPLPSLASTLWFMMLLLSYSSSRVRLKQHKSPSAVMVASRPLPSLLAHVRPCAPMCVCVCVCVCAHAYVHALLIVRDYSIVRTLFGQYDKVNRLGASLN